MRKAFVFPGQGSQNVGMGKALADTYPAARAVFDEVDDALGQKLSAIMWEGPSEALTMTENAQPALMAVSMAVVRTLNDEYGFKLSEGIDYVAGHSLGEYSALCAAGTFSITDTARLLRARGRAMQQAVPVGKGAMAALLGVGMDVARAVAENAARGDVCDIANDNDPGQVVLSGSKSAIDRVLEIAKSHGVRRVMPLPVSAPFHCSLMQPAAEAMAEALAAAKILRPVVPLVANVSAAPTSDPAAIRRCLVEQVTGTVRWRESVLAMVSAGVSDFYEIGTGKVLAGLVGRIDRASHASSIGEPEAVEVLAGQLDLAK